MEVKDLLCLEHEGLAETIFDYTTEKYIRSYVKKLGSLNYPKDRDLMIIVVNRLLEWYSTNLDEIKDSKYLVNKQDHEKSAHILEELSILLKKTDKKKYTII